MKVWIFGALEIADFNSKLSKCYSLFHWGVLHNSDKHMVFFKVEMASLPHLPFTAILYFSFLFYSSLLVSFSEPTEQKFQY